LEDHIIDEIESNLTAVASLSSNLISGYNRDLQDSKKIIFESLDLAENSLKATSVLLVGLTPNQTKLKAAMTPELFATHIALEQTLAGTPFRDAYSYINNQLGKLKKLDDINLKQIFKQSSHEGGTGSLGLTQLSQKVSLEKKKWHKENNAFKEILLNLLTEHNFPKYMHKETQDISPNSKTHVSLL
jgi:argininosuccinate lyase